MIYTVGDSHAIHAWLKIPGVITNGVGPMLMYSFGLSRVNILSGIPEDAIVVFCWGEIDCRCHVYKHPPWEETIDTLVKNYLETIDVNAKTHKNIWLYNVLPPPRKQDAISENPGFPFLGTDGDRLSFVRRMNKLLRASSYPFVDIYDKYADEDGFLKMEYSDGHVHIEDERFLVEWLDKHLAEQGAGI